MKILNVIETDFINYKKPCMTIEMPYCSFKCNKECGKEVCQNTSLATAPLLDTSVESLIYLYQKAVIPEAVCFQGLEPFDSYQDLCSFIKSFREKFNDDIVIYSGYTEDELKEQIEYLKQFKNIVIKFGRYLPEDQKHYDPILEVCLASNNQYARRIS